MRSRTEAARAPVEGTLRFTWENPGIVYDRFGHPVDTAASVWKLNDPTRPDQVKWTSVPANANVVEAAKAYLSFVIETKAQQTAGNFFRIFSEAATRCDAFREYPVPVNDLTHLLEYFHRRQAAWKFHWIRTWYTWCADVEIPGFSQEIRQRLMQYKVGGNETGVAVLSADPEEGPLDNTEHHLLRTAVKEGKGALRERVCVMLCLELGANPKSLVLLEERDFLVVPAPRGEAFYTLEVPRIKKRTAHRSTRTRKISTYLGAALERLVEENHKRYGRPYREKSPILRRPCSAGRELPTPTLKRFEFHLTVHDFAARVSRYPKAADIVSPRTGEWLHLTPRRLRYTFATRLVEQGASPAVVADLLDHVGLQHIGVYFKARENVVTHLDQALGRNPHYLHIVNRFVGTLVSRDPTEDPRRRIDGDTPTHKSLGGIGVCGASQLCGLYPPLSCYLCPQFQAWIDGPHREMLEELETYARDFSAASGHPSGRIPNQIDGVIQAITELLQKIAH
jgi:integrase